MSAISTTCAVEPDHRRPIHERIPTHPDHDGEPVYWEPEVRAAATTIVDLPGGLLAVAEPLDGSWTHVAIFAYVGGPATQNGVEVEPRCYQRIMHGEGPSGSLRELRHTHWGDPHNAGYIFYPSANLICAAFSALERWFDCD